MTALRKYIPAVAMGFSVIAIVVAGSMFRVALLFIIIGALAVLLGAVYTWQGSKSEVARDKRFWALIKASVIFVGGAEYGIVESLREGWRWVDLLFLIVPTGLAAYLIWYAFRLRRTAESSMPPKEIRSV